MTACQNQICYSFNPLRISHQVHKPKYLTSWLYSPLNMHSGPSPFCSYYRLCAQPIDFTLGQKQVFKTQLKEGFTNIKPSWIKNS